MHNKALALAKWGYEQAECKGYDCLTSQDWDDLKDCMEVAEKSIKCEYYHRIIEEMKSGEYRMTPEMFKEHSAEYYRDMDLQSKNVRYYTEPLEEKPVSKSEKARQKYHEDGTQDNFDNFTKELISDLTEIWGTIGNVEKTMMKSRLQALLTKMG